MNREQAEDLAQEYIRSHENWSPDEIILEGGEIEKFWVFHQTHKSGKTLYGNVPIVVTKETGQVRGMPEILLEEAVRYFV